MKTVIGYGNELRGEDAFGIDVIKRLELEKVQNVQLLSLYQLTPEIVLDLLESDEIIFIDACYENKNNYKLACSLENTKALHLSHHISYRVIIHMLNSLYDRYPKYQVYSMFTSNFDDIIDFSQYKEAVEKTSTYLLQEFIKS